MRTRRLANLLSTLTIALVLLGGAGVDSFTQLRYSVNSKVNGWNWALVTWEIEAIGQKLGEGVRQPAAALSPDEQAALVQSYLERARKIGELEGQIERIYSETGGVANEESAALQWQLDELRAVQEPARPAAEVILEAQITAELLDEGISWFGGAFPPVWFTFTEPPKKLVVSPRARITTAHYAMLQPDAPSSERERIETAILQEENLSAYITNIGGLGAYPTQVIDRAPLDWVLSTVAHEWVHNYLTLFPLGINYSTTSDLTIMNETVADIIGDEIGRRALKRYYPDIAQKLGEREAALESGEEAPPDFDFRKEMRHTREIVDLFLSLGRIEDAEQYMEIRRLLFVENGHAIRKLNQAYFAFHGSYGTGAAATSPIGPKMEELRSLTPDMRTFLSVVRGFTSPEDLDRALEEWRK
ncbi:MAG: hypothetical protein R6W76_12010 [Caldilinea sp.]